MNALDFIAIMLAVAAGNVLSTAIVFTILGLHQAEDFRRLIEGRRR